MDSETSTGRQRNGIEYGKITTGDLWRTDFVEDIKELNYG